MKTTSPFFLSQGQVVSDLLEFLAQKWILRTKNSGLKQIIFLDTFDWRLFKAGFILKQIDDRLVLQTLAKGQNLYESHQVARPVFRQDINEGALKARVVPLIDVRALLPLVGVAMKQTLYGVLDKDEKIITRLLYQESTLLETESALLHAQIEVHPLRGYAKEAQAIEADLGVYGLSPGSAHALYYKAMATVERFPGDYGPTLSLSLTPTMRADEAALAIHRFMLKVMKANVPYIIQDIDTEFLHDFRVAVRRSRSALSQIKAVFPAEQTLHFKQTLSYIGKLTNVLRDFDVYLLSESAYRAMLPAHLQNGITPLFNLLRKKRKKALQHLKKEFGTATYKQAMAEWETFLDKPLPSHPTAINAACPIIELAKKRIYKHYRLIVKNGQNILARQTVPDEALHSLRLECKKIALPTGIF